MTGRRNFPTRATAMEASDDEPLGPPKGDTIGDVIARRYNRRDILQGALGVTAATALFGPAALAATKVEDTGSRFTFDEVAAGANETHHVAKGYDAEIFLRWGDPLFPDSPPFDPHDQSADAQRRQFGYNNDYIAYFPIDGSSAHGLLCVNHEYTNEELMFPELDKEQFRWNFEDMTRALVDVEMAAHGITIVEVKKVNGAWQVVRDSRYNRRITANTEMTADGPAAGSARFKTKQDDTGKQIFGTVNNCAGGMTPWNTYLTAEENFHGYFWTKHVDANYQPNGTFGGSQRASYRQYRVPGRWTAWGKYYERFDVDIEENEPNRFGWIVEIDPFDPTSTPVKHTALGRFFHEGAETVLSKDDRAVVFSGDDAVFQYVYRFVSDGTYVKGNNENNRKLLSKGTLSVAEFSDDGTGKWLPLRLGEGDITEDCSDGAIKDDADVVIDARIAAGLAGATSMDRPEDVQPNEANGRIYVMLTNNTSRKAGNTNVANPRPDNAFGHIIEIAPKNGDFGADTFTWDILVRCGDPAKIELGAYWNAATSKNSWFVCPDNAEVDDQGRLWIATDQGRHWQKKTERADGLYALETEGVRRGTPRMFFRVPVGAEMAGPRFTPDGQTLFLSVQHPGADGVSGYSEYYGPSTFKNPATRWPDFKDGMPPRPSVVVVTKKGGGKIG